MLENYHDTNSHENPSQCINSKHFYVKSHTIAGNIFNKIVLGDKNSYFNKNGKECKVLRFFCHVK